MAEKAKVDAAKETAAPAAPAAGQEAPKPPEKKGKKLVKNIEGSVVKIKEGVTGKEMAFDFSKLPEAIQKNFGPFGLGHKLGDAAAGKEGKEAVEAIEKVWDGLMKGDWTVRAPASEKVSKNALLEKYFTLPPAQRVIVKPILEASGIDVNAAEAAQKEAEAKK